MSIIFNTFHCLSRKCRTKLIERYDKGTFCNIKLPPVEVVLGLFLPKHCTIIPDSRARHIKFGGHLGGFGANMFEAEINKGKEKNRTLCLPSISLTIKQVII